MEDHDAPIDENFEAQSFFRGDQINGFSVEVVHE